MSPCRPLAAAAALLLLAPSPAFAARSDCCKQTAIVKPAFDPDILADFEPTAGERRDQARGKVTVRIRDTASATMKVVQSEWTIRAPAGSVWGVITDYAFYPRLFAQMDVSETLLAEGEWEHHYTVVRYPWPWGQRWVLNTIHHDRSRLVARFKRVEGSIREVEGRWELREKASALTALRYGVRLDPGLEFIPTWVIPWATSFVVPGILRSVGKEAEARWARTQEAAPGGGGGREPDRPAK